MTQDSKKIIKNSLLAVFFILILGYALFVSKDLIFGVRIRDVSLTDGTVFTENVQEVTGNARNAIHLYLNGREISINQEGDFKETIALLPGYNIISIRAEDKFGLTDEKNYKLMLQE
jgi:hypothetical protein